MSYALFARNESVRLGLLLVMVALTSGFVPLGQSSSHASRAAISERRGAQGSTSRLGAYNLPALSPVAEGDETTRLRATAEYGKLPLSFEANHGQTDPQVQFLSRGAGYTLFLTPTKAVLSLQQRMPESGASQEQEQVQRVPNVLRMALVGANPAAKVAGLDQLPGKSNYFIGNDPQKWQVNVPTFASVLYQDIYQGVDLVYYGNQRRLENDFVVAPGADPGVINLTFDGAKKVSTDAAGNLVLETAGGQVQLQKPVIYQLTDGVRQEVAGSYVLSTSHGPSPESQGTRQETAETQSDTPSVGFEVAAYPPVPIMSETTSPSRLV